MHYEIKYADIRWLTDQCWFYWICHVPNLGIDLDVVLIWLLMEVVIFFMRLMSPRWFGWDVWDIQSCFFCCLIWNKGWTERREARVGQRLALECGAAGGGQRPAQWRRCRRAAACDDALPAPAVRVDQRGRLVFDAIGREDEGLYRCSSEPPPAPFAALSDAGDLQVRRFFLSRRSSGRRPVWNCKKRQTQPTTVVDCSGAATTTRRRRRKRRRSQWRSFRVPVVVDAGVHFRRPFDLRRRPRCVSCFYSFSFSSTTSMARSLPKGKNK